MSVILLERDILHYEVLGRGRPILFLHGWVGSWRYWIPAMQAISASYRAYAVDLWGFGDSAREARRYPLEQQVELVGNFLEQMGVGRVALIGHGLGAILAMQLALQRPEWIDRLMAVSLPLEPDMLNPRMRLAAPAELADWLLGQLPPGEPARVDAPRADLQAIQASLSDFQAIHLRESLRGLQAPCLLVYGENDPAVTLPRFDEGLALNYKTHAIAFEASGHFPMLDEGSKFNRLLIDFLAIDADLGPVELQLKEEWKRRVR